MISKSSIAACFLSIMLTAVAHAVSPPAKAPLGGGEPPDIELSTTYVLFGEVHTYGSGTQSLVVSNVGTGNLNVTLSITGGGASHFLVTDPLDPFQVQPGGQQEIFIDFYPTEIGTQEATLQVFSNDQADPVLFVTLSGNGYESYVVSITGAPSRVLPNGSITFTIVLDSPAGPGDMPIQITTSPTALIEVPPEVVAPQGATQVQFKATAGPVLGTETVYALLHTYFAYDEIEISNTVAVEDAPPGTLLLYPVVPNPVRRAAQVAFALPSSTRVRLGVFDLMGRSVATLANGVFPAGRHVIPWKPGAAARGMYLLRLESLGETRTVKAVVTP